MATKKKSLLQIYLSNHFLSKLFRKMMKKCIIAINKKYNITRLSECYPGLCAVPLRINKASHLKLTN